MKKLFPVLLCCFFITRLAAQETFPVNGPKDVKPELYAFINAKIITDADHIIENGTLVIRGKNIESVVAGSAAPKGAIVIDLKGKCIYPAFIDIYTSYGLPELRKNSKDGPQFTSSRKGAYNWNDAIRPETNARDLFSVDKKKADELRKLGFGSVLSINKDGIVRGTSVFVNLNSKRENEVILKENVSANYSFSKGYSTQDYPSSLMGSIALLRQTLYDAQWYKNGGNKIEYNISLDAINKELMFPQIFEASDLYDVFRAQKVADEFKLSFIYKVNGTEYQRIQELKKINVPLIVPLNFPAAYDVEDVFDASNVSLSQMKHWETAPFNPAILESQKIQFALTTSDLKNTSDFWKNLRLAVKNGLSEKQALNSLTIIPATMLNVGDKVGSLKKGMLANFIITSDNIFIEKSKIYESWVQGERMIIQDMNVKDIRGDYRLSVTGLGEFNMKVSGEMENPEFNIINADSSKLKLFVSRTNDLITIVFDSDNANAKGKIRLSGYFTYTPSITMKGEGTKEDGSKLKWSAVYVSVLKPEEKKKEEDKKQETYGSIIYPFTAYGWKEAPKQEKIIIKNATVWTNEKEGKIANTDVLIDKGKIVSVGKNINAGDARVIDGTGKHVTPGIVDEHSHIAIARGVNEGTQAISAEVRIGDVLNPSDINIYRQLAGGVTTSQLLHGSANPVGGQSALIKLRWGKSAEDLKFEGADPFIKFALGENVKQSNWGEKNTVRYPQTRMGVEQVYYDGFIRAKEYEQQLKSSDKNKTLVRKDLELDALVEILNDKRFITCHSYVQSEINMLMHVADSMGFNVNTFTHILEGYKVADKMKARNIGGSTFSDWWAYKYEVIEAIPYNGAIMNKVGVVTAFNSDDAEMARRLNQEAGKAVKYGNVPEEEALKFVTLNPAKLLHIDNRVGSIKVGKDADLVLWSDHPLSVYAKAEKTFVDGIAYYDIEKDLLLRDELTKERARIIQKMLIEKKIGNTTQKPDKKENKLYHCDDMEDEGR